MKTVVLGMSGGVDSSVCAKLLLDKGYKVIGLFMRNWDSFVNNDILGNNNNDVCTSEEDWKDAQSVAKQLNIEIHRVDFVKEYWDYVFKYFISEYKKGRTPNPDILCNKFIKFDYFANYAFSKYNADYISMGHYANVTNGKLMRALDQTKDQTYFLSQLTNEQLSKVIFPLGNINKSEVRKIAKEANLSIADKKDSTGICFIGERDFTKFLQNYIPAQPGDIVDVTNMKIVGSHIGAMYYTIGQRKGLNLGGMKEPYYVCGNDISKRIIYVAPLSQKEYITAKSCEVNNIVFNNQEFDPTKLTAKFRYRQKDIKVKVKFDATRKNAFVQMLEEIESVTPGQQCVFYYNDYCLGGGTINNVINLKDIK